MEVGHRFSERVRMKGVLDYLQRCNCLSNDASAVAHGGLKLIESD